MGGEVTVYSGWLGAGLAGGMSGMALKLSPGMLSKPGICGICIPLVGGMPPPMPPMLEDMLEDMLPMFMPPILLIILFIMSSIPRDFMSPMPPIILGMPPPMPTIIGGMGPPDDIMVEDDDEEGMT